MRFDTVFELWKEMEGWDLSGPGPSAAARQIAGTFIEDRREPQPPVMAWIQAECRTGCFAPALKEALQTEPEPLRLELALVERVEPERIVVKIPCRVADHESSGCFSSEVLFELDPSTLRCARI
jgi:hypothetical protein